MCPTYLHYKVMRVYDTWVGNGGEGGRGNDAIGVICAIRCGALSRERGGNGVGVSPIMTEPFFFFSLFVDGVVEGGGGRDGMIGWRWRWYVADW